MDEEKLRQYLKKQGKKDHVVAQLAGSVRLFADYLEKETEKTLETASGKELGDYAAVCESAKKGSTKTAIRGIKYYYDFTGNREMSGLAAEIREGAVGKSRTVFKLKDFPGINGKYVQILKDIGITDIDLMIENGKTPDMRKNLASRTGIPVDAVLELVKLSNLARKSSVKGVRSRLYVGAGLDTWDKIACLEVNELREICARYISKTGFNGIPPTPKEAFNTIEAARTIPRIVTW